MSSTHNDFPTPPTPEELAYILNKVSSHRKRLVASYSNPARWILAPENIDAELGVEIFVGVEKYWPKPIDEFVKIVKSMMNNRCRDLFRYANKTHRRVEYSAYVLPEEDSFPAFSVEVVDNPRDFMWAGGMASLSSLATNIVEQFFDPDEAMDKILQEHVAYRRSLWGGDGEIGGAGVKRIPVPVLAQAHEVSEVEVKDALEEIKQTLFWEEAVMTTQDAELIEELLSNIDWEKQLQWPGNVIDTRKRHIQYVRWAQTHIQGQFRYRLEHDETFAKRVAKEFPNSVVEGELANLDAIKRQDLIHYLKEDDEKNGRMVVKDYEEFETKPEKEKEKEDMSTKAEKLPVAVVDDGFDESFTRSKSTDEEKPAEDSFEDFGPAVKEEESVEETAPEEKPEEPEKEESGSIEGEHQFEGDPLTEIMNRMRKGDVLHVTYEGKNHWTMVVVENETTVKEDSNDASTEQEGDEPKKFKTGSAEWHAVVWSEEYKEFSLWAETPGTVYKAIKEEAVDFTPSENINPGLNLKNAKSKLAAARGIKTYHKDYDTPEKRKKVTL